MNVVLSEDTPVVTLHGVLSIQRVGREGWQSRSMEWPPFAVMYPMLSFWPYVAAVLHVVLAVVASGHAVLTKRDTRAAIGWVGMIWFAPLVGVLLYIWLGINRIERRARSLRADRPRPASSSGLCQCPPEILDRALTPEGTHLKHLITLVRDVTRRPLLAGNRVTPLVNGDDAYPAMLQAIDEAERSVTLTTYIFRHDAMGQRFLEALRRAVSRQVPTGGSPTPPDTANPGGDLAMFGPGGGVGNNVYFVSPESIIDAAYAPTGEEETPPETGGGVGLPGIYGAIVGAILGQTPDGDPVNEMLNNLDMRKKGPGLRAANGRALGHANLEAGILEGQMQVGLEQGAVKAGELAIKGLRKIPAAGEIGNAIGHGIAGEKLNWPETIEGVLKNLFEISDELDLEDVDLDEDPGTIKIPLGKDPPYPDNTGGLPNPFREGAPDLPYQQHHFATDKNSTYTPRMEKIADEYDLDLDGDWNKEILPHLGRHPNEYHQFVLDGMRRAAKEAGDDKEKFLELFDQYVKEPIRKNPQLLRKIGWTM